MKNYKAYLFDIDGTLIDTAELIYQCFKFSCKKFKNVDVKRETVLAHIGMTLRAQLETYVGTLTDKEATEIEVAHMDYQKTIYQDYLRLFPQVSETLQELKHRGSKVAAVTSRKRYSVEKYLKLLKIYDYFDLLITPESTNKHKPDPEPARVALEQLGVCGGESLFIGDTEYDIRCGASAGTDTAYVTWSNSELPKTVSSTYKIDKIDSLL